MGQALERKEERTEMGEIEERRCVGGEWVDTEEC